MEKKLEKAAAPDRKDIRKAPLPIQKLYRVVMESLERTAIEGYIERYMRRGVSPDIKNKTLEMRNRYLLFLYNNYSNQKYCFEVFNSACGPDKYVFEDFDKVIPADLPYGTYDYALLHCSIPYLLVLRPTMLDSEIIVEDGTFTLRQLRPETGLLEFRPDGKGNDVWDSVLGSDRLYIDM